MPENPDPGTSSNTGARRVQGTPEDVGRVIGDEFGEDAGELAQDFLRENDLIQVDTVTGEIDDQGNVRVKAAQTGTELKDDKTGLKVNVNTGEVSSNVGPDGASVKVQRDFITVDSGNLTPDGTKVSGHVGEVWAEAKIGENEALIGAHADIAGIDAQVGDDQNHIKGGLSEGLGLGAGATYGADSDGDGYTEWGVSGEAGPVSLGVKAEPGYLAEQGAAAAADAAAEAQAAAERAADDPLGAAQAAAEASAQGMVDAAAGGLQAQSDYSEAIVNIGSQAVEAASGALDQGADTWSAAATDAYDTVAEAGQQLGAMVEDVPVVAPLPEPSYTDAAPEPAPEASYESVVESAPEGQW